jgi:hypothetical protein
MARNDRQPRIDRSWRILLALVCVLLVVVLGVVQVAHTHHDGTEHADCAFCAAAHITVHTAQTPSPVPATQVVAVLESLPPTSLPRFPAIFAHFTRPPPVADIVPA